ncbi:MAG: hypothetical protein H0W59_10555 [Chloroflexia bacterium]|nr:hypothetical protein [Chloroflexia bacterium]
MGERSDAVADSAVTEGGDSLHRRIAVPWGVIQSARRVPASHLTVKARPKESAWRGRR